MTKVIIGAYKCLCGSIKCNSRTTSINKVAMTITFPAGHTDMQTKWHYTDLHSEIVLKKKRCYFSIIDPSVNDNSKNMSKKYY
jgi:hypothetical protein